VTDACSGGACSAVDRERFASAKITTTVKPGLGDDRFVLGVTFPATSLVQLPSESGVEIELRGADGSLAYASLLPAANIINASGRGVVFRFRDKKGNVPEANGIISAQIKRNSRKGTVKLKARMRGVEMDQLVALQRVSMVVLFGNDPVVGDCVSGFDYSCRAKGRGKVVCSS